MLDRAAAGTVADLQARVATWQAVHNRWRPPWLLAVVGWVGPCKKKMHTMNVFRIRRQWHTGAAQHRKTERRVVGLVRYMRLAVTTVTELIPTQRDSRLCLLKRQMQGGAAGKPLPVPDARPQRGHS